MRLLASLPAFLYFLGAGLMAQTPRAPRDEFGSLVKMAPFVVNGKSLQISIYARSGSDRRYGEAFAEGVAKVVYEAVTESTGRGLVIIGAKGEPHPSLVFRKFLALAQDGKLDPAIAARAPELATIMEQWQHALHINHESGGDVDMDFENIFTALPLPLAGLGAKLYQLAWEEKFDPTRVEAKLRALQPGDLERRDRFKAYDWVFYLPPKGAFDRVLDDLIAEALKQEKLGIMQRVVVKGALLVVKPKIRRTIEVLRQGLMFMTVVKAQTPYTEDEVSALTEAYVECQLPFDSDAKKPPGRNDHERAVNAVRDQIRKNTEKADARAIQ